MITCLRRLVECSDCSDVLDQLVVRLWISVLHGAQYLWGHFAAPASCEGIKEPSCQCATASLPVCYCFPASVLLLPASVQLLPASVLLPPCQCATASLPVCYCFPASVLLPPCQCATAIAAR